MAKQAKISAAEKSQLEINILLASASANAIAYAHIAADASGESEAIKEAIKELKASMVGVIDQGYRAVLAMHVEEKLALETIKALCKEANGGKAIPGAVRVACTFMAQGIAAGYKATMQSTRGDFKKAADAKKAADEIKANGKAADRANGDNDQGINTHGDTVKGELSDMAVIKQAMALLCVDKGLRALHTAEIAKLFAIVNADAAKAEKDAKPAEKKSA